MTNEKLLDLYSKMVTLRQFDDMCRALKTKDIVWSGYHPYTGQEAVAVGCCGQLEKDDFLVGNHRSHCHAVAKGSSVRTILTEMMGRQTGVSGGLGGAMQFIDADNNFFSGSIVGSGIPIAAGIAMAMKQKETSSVCLCLFGDGATNTGSFHEGLNLAAIWKLPVVYVCENNQFGEALPAREFVSADPISKRAHAYGLEAITVDGNDVEAVYAATANAIDKARAGDGPVLLEALTYRIRGHYVGDPEQTYRSKEEVEEWKQKCPIKRCKGKLIERGIKELQVEELEKEIEIQLEQDKVWALEQPFATLQQATENVWIPLDTAR